MIFIWTIDKKKKEAAYQQLIRQVIASIQQGELLPGQRILSERKLAQQLEINRSTVVHALEDLESLGWLVRKQGSGTQVATGQWGNHQAAIYHWQSLFSSPLLKEDPYLTELKRLKTDPASLDLYTGDLGESLIPDFNFPAMSWEQIMLEEKQVTPTGYQPLKEEITRHFFQSQAYEDQKLLITSGSTQGIFLLIQVLLNPGDCIATEVPSFLFSLPLFASRGIHLEGIGQDEEGIHCQQLEELIQRKKIKLLYLNPNYQNPTGHTMSLKSRKEVIRLCQKYQLPIVEDNVFGELGFTRSLPSLKSLAPDLVIYLGSLSKIFSPSIKIGWLFAPQALIRSLTNAKKILENETDLLPQLLATAALSQTDYSRQQKYLSNKLEEKSQIFEKIIRSFSADWHYQSIGGGLYYWLTWRHQDLSRTDWQLFLQEKLLVAPSFLFSNETLSVRMNYSRLDSNDLATFKQRFARITTLLKRDS